MSTDLVIKEGDKVTLHFSLTLEDGSVVDSNFDGIPAAFTVGDGKILPGFEKELVGLKVGDRETITIEPEKGFGQPNPNNVVTMPRSNFDPKLELKPGLICGFSDANKAEVPGVIKSLTESEVVVDFNHPLSGRTVTFDVQILNIKEQ